MWRTCFMRHSEAHLVLMSSDLSDVSCYPVGFLRLLLKLFKVDCGLHIDKPLVQSVVFIFDRLEFLVSQIFIQTSGGRRQASYYFSGVESWRFEVDGKHSFEELVVLTFDLFSTKNVCLAALFARASRNLFEVDVGPHVYDVAHQPDLILKYLLFR